MMNKLKNRTHLLCLIFAVVVAGAIGGSCSHDGADMDENVVLRLHYYGDGQEDCLRQKINSVAFYLFNPSGVMVKRWNPGNDGLLQGEVRLALKPGNYTVVALGNAGERTTVYAPRKKAYYADYVVTTPSLVAQASTTDGMDAVYVGQTEVAVSGDSLCRADLTFHNAHYDVVVEVKGILQVEESEEHLTKKMAIGDTLKEQNSVFLYYHNATSGFAFPLTGMTGKDCTCTAPLYWNPQQQLCTTRDFHIFRYPKDEYKGNSSFIEVYDNLKRRLCTVSLADFLQAHPEIRLDREEVVIPIELEFTNGEVKLGVPRWYLNAVAPEFGDKISEAGN